MQSLKILICFEANSNSLQGLETGLLIAKELKGYIYLLHVTDKPDNNNLNEIIRGSNKNLPNSEVIIKEGKIDEAILETANEIEADLIIMQPDVFNKELKYYEESLSGKVLKNSNHPILIIPPLAEIQHVRNFIYISDLRENIIGPIKNIVKIINTSSKYISVLILPEDHHEWQLKSDLFSLIENLKNYINYYNISSHICHSNDTLNELIGFIREDDIICVEKDSAQYYNIFFGSKLLKNKMIFERKVYLILPSYPDDSAKTV